MLLLFVQKTFHERNGRRNSRQRPGVRWSYTAFLTIPPQSEREGKGKREHCQKEALCKSFIPEKQFDGNNDKRAVDLIPPTTVARPFLPVIQHSLTMRAQPHYLRAAIAERCFLLAQPGSQELPFDSPIPAPA